MYWLTFVALSLALYLPPFYLAEQLWRWAEGQYWWLVFLGWHCPPWLGYVSWLAIGYVALGTLAHLAHRRLPEDGGLGQLAREVSRAGLGAAGVIMASGALAILLLAWPILPLLRTAYGWRYAISPPVAALAALFLLAEALRLAETNVWADRTFAARRESWLVEHGYHR